MNDRTALITFLGLVAGWYWGYPDWAPYMPWLYHYDLIGLGVVALFLARLR